MITLLIGKQEENGTKSSRETCRMLRLRRPHHGRIPHGKIGIHGGGILQSLTKGSFGLPERGTDNSMGGVHRIHTRSVRHEQYSLLTSTNMKCVLVAQELNGPGLQRHQSAHEMSLSSGQPCHLLAGLHRIFSLPVHRNTKHHLDSTTCSKTTLYIEHLFQNLFSRQAALKNHSRTSTTRVAESREQTLSHTRQERCSSPPSLSP